MANKPIRRFCFTLNNYTEEEYAKIKAYCEIKASFAVIGKEVGAEGTPHLQGYVNLKSPTRFTAVKKLINRIHIEVAQGNDEQNLAYCTKEDQEPFIVGEPQHKGKRNDLEEFKRDADKGMSYDEALSEHSAVLARYSKFAREYIARVARDKMPHMVIENFRDWQVELIMHLGTAPNDRHIMWYVDPIGGKGKTYIAKYLVINVKAFYTNGGKSIDIFYAYQGERTAIFDFVRESQDFVNYAAIEAIKNGILSSGKYESTLKIFPSPHVIVFANFPPAAGKLSADRVKIIEM